MTPMTIVLALASFVGFLLLFLLMLPRSTAQSALLEQVTRDARGAAQEKTARSWRLDTDLLAKPFSAIRKLMTPAPDAELVRRLMLAGYKKPAHADIFLGARLAGSAALGDFVSLGGSTHHQVSLPFALFVGLLFPKFYRSPPAYKMREKNPLAR